MTPRVALGISVVITIILYMLPFGIFLAWPLILLSTIAHEVGHGVTAWCVGGSFHALHLYADASGAATWSGDVGRMGRAAVAAGGLLGPAVVAAILFCIARSTRGSQWALASVGLGLLAISCGLAANWFGMIFIASTGFICLGIAGIAGAEASRFTLIFVATQLALSVYSRGDYLFVPTAQTELGPMPSDTSVMAEALILPFWFWGLVCGFASVIVLLVGFITTLRQEST